MGMPGSEVALEELMCRIMGSLVMDGSMAKIADDMCGDCGFLLVFILLRFCRFGETRNGMHSGSIVFDSKHRTFRD